MIHRLMNPRVCYVKTISNNMLPQRQFSGLTCRISNWTQPQWTPIESATTRLAIQINFFTPSHQISRNSTREWAEKLRRLYKSHEKYKIDDDSNEDQLQLCWIRLLPPISRNSSASELKSSESNQNQHRTTLDVERKHRNAYLEATSSSMEGLFGDVNPPSAISASDGDGGEEWGGENGEGAVYVFPRAERPVSSARARAPGLRARVPGLLSPNPPLARAGYPRWFERGARARAGWAWRGRAQPG